MLFNTLNYLCFFPIVVLVYFLLATKLRWIWLLFASYFFYMCWKPEYALLIFTSTLVTWVSSLLIHKYESLGKKKFFLVSSLLINLGILFFFKYYGFFQLNTNGLLSYLNININLPNFDILLPVGISFYTFQALGYTIDVYQKKIKPELNLGKYALFVSFFPQLVAGPIERSTHLLPQFSQKFTFDYDRIKDGLIIIIWGLVKKVVIADRLAMFVNPVYDNPTAYSGLNLILATVFFAFQIYADFSSYSDIAVGSAKVMGFDLMENFRRPYLAKTIGEFWRRWHISLSTWFRDYLYLPLGGSRVSKLCYFRNILIIFVVSGIWHGASWNFLVWGALHGFYMIFGGLLMHIRNKTRSFC